jgi:MvdD pre-ATP grasp domain
MSAAAPIVLILAGECDEHARAVRRALAERGVETARLDTAKYPSEVRIGWTCGADTPRLTLQLSDGRRLTGEQIGAVWSRRRPRPDPRRINDPALREWVASESMALLDTLPHLLPVPWLDRPERTAVASRKPLGLLLAQRLGFAIPETALGNEPRQMLRLTEGEGDLALKSISVPFVDLEASPAGGERVHGEGVREHPSRVRGIVMYTRRVEPRALRERAASIALAPLTAQRYVEKDYELRVTVVGGVVHACAIHSQVSPHTRQDWRRYDLEHTPHEAVELPAEVAERCRALVRAMGLRFGCLDLILTPAGEYVFLECNPVGAFLWIEQLTGLPISSSLAELLESLATQPRSNEEVNLDYHSESFI